jgi:hypothetical protein
LGWTLAALVALAVETLLGEVSDALCLLAAADALLQTPENSVGSASTAPLFIELT